MKIERSQEWWMSRIELEGEMTVGAGGMSSKERWRRGMADILSELERLYEEDEMGAVQINIAKRDGGVRTLRAYDDGFKILLIAAAAIGQAEALQIPTIDKDTENWETPAVTPTTGPKP